MHEKAIQELRNIATRHELLPLIEENQGTKTSLSISLPFLLQLNITRFGTITIVAIALGVLSPLYRFSARLSTYYQARADALRLHKVAYKQTGIIRITSMLTPTFDFAKAQTTTHEQRAELARIIALRGKDDE